MSIAPIQQSCEIVEEMLAKEIDKKFPTRLSTVEFIALNNLLLELQATNKYTIPKGIN